MFDITRGIFILCWNTGFEIRNCTSFKGHDYGKNTNVKLSQYTDEAFCLKKNNRNFVKKKKKKKWHDHAAFMEK